MRVLVRLLSTVLALVLAGCGALLALEVGWHWWKPQSAPLLVPWPRWRDHLAGLDWTATPVRLTAAVVLVAGLLFVFFSLGARSRAVRMTDPADGISVSTSPRSLARMVGLAVRAQDNVSGASVTASARRVRVRASSRLEDEAQLRPRLLETVGTVLDEVPLVRRPKVTVVVDSPKDRR
ncbi:DUF6286 domain-containing protein [Amycolatopsis saalfeldensis]|uniref:DUF6286 domain-containing protein n=1 Tax=Amycolatopsis saalfeldensis TaxID=394193 RepID=A0A1H8XU79_9PSEU|nr:DUF6286 domain-containing protein [Amycolatopsis saalfeldensis]SEP43322.1 hypothetical protein SAMN04489732_10922 [Amycolatopsis saalfeldensis]